MFYCPEIQNSIYQLTADPLTYAMTNLSSLSAIRSSNPALGKAIVSYTMLHGGVWRSNNSGFKCEQRKATINGKYYENELYGPGYAGSSNLRPSLDAVIPNKIPDYYRNYSGSKIESLSPQRLPVMTILDLYTPVNALRYPYWFHGSIYSLCNAVILNIFYVSLHTFIMMRDDRNSD